MRLWPSPLTPPRQAASDIQADGRSSEGRDAVDRPQAPAHLSYGHGKGCSLEKHVCPSRL